MAAQLILGLTILVGLHELGHMLSAKWFGMRVEKFAIGFPPKLLSKKFGETEYMIGAVPLGGFVKISGMVDESLDTANLNQAPEPWEFRAKPAWQRLIVMLGGIIVNIVTGIVVFVIMTYKHGESYLPASEVKYGIVANELGQQMGFRTGDKIVKLNGQPLDEFTDIYNPDVLLGENTRFTVVRDGREVELGIPKGFLDKMLDKNQKIFVEPRQPFQVGRVMSGTPADKAGVQNGDFIRSVNGQPVQFFHELQATLAGLKEKQVPVVVERDGQQQTLQITVDENGHIGFQPKLLLNDAKREYSLAQSIPVGTEKAFSIITGTIKSFGKIFAGEVSASKSLSGPIGIAQMFGSDWDWNNFWILVGMLSMLLAFMNALPIPALDGGHVLFLTYELVTGQKPSDKFLENAQKIGMILLLGLMAFAFFNDVFKLFN